MIHLDLFSGIGGFSLAFDNVFHEQKNTHIFCEIDPFCQAVLKKHWPDSYIHDNIRSFATNAFRGGYFHGRPKKLATESKFETLRESLTGVHSPFILTGGFPCQPFSQAGRRKGTEDDRHLWPEMLRVIKATQPQWVVAENVRGLLTINGGVVFEQVCADLESAGYEVQPIVIPAVAVNAPHRRDRVWFVAHRRQQYGSKWRDEGVGANTTKWTTRKPDIERRSQDDADTKQSRLERGKRKAGQGQCGQSGGVRNSKERQAWDQNWLEVATRLCRVDDGLPRRMDRNPRLKALGNAIVPQVAEEIMRAIKSTL